MKNEGRFGAALAAIIVALFLPGGAAVAASPYLDVPLNTVKQAVTASGYPWMPELFGGPDQHYAIFRLGPLAAGASYAATLEFSAQDGPTYAASWVDGDPAGKRFRSLLSVPAGAGLRETTESGDTFLFSVDGQSTSNLLYLVVRSSEPASLAVAVTGRPPGFAAARGHDGPVVGVTDVEAEGGAPFLLSMGPTAGAAARSDPAAYVDLLPNMARRLLTASVFPSMPAYFGGPEGYYTVLRLAPLARGRRYELTLTYDAGTDMDFSSTWVDGDPLSRDFWSFANIEDTTGTRAIRNKQQKFLFRVDPDSSANTLHLVLRSSRRWPVSVGLTDRPYGVLTRDSRDSWGELYVTDFDADGPGPFLLTRARR